jgi:FSR family fosmidomycin resistance protein-like MFS transporter
LILSFIFVLPLALAFINLLTVWGLIFLATMGFFLSSSTSVNIILSQELVPTQASFMSSIMMGLGWGTAGLVMTPIGAMADRLGLYWTLTAVSFLPLVGLILVYFFRYEK